MKPLTSKSVSFFGGPVEIILQRRRGIRGKRRFVNVEYQD